MNSDLPKWVPILSALLTPMLAGFAVCVAWQQWKTAREKIKLDLFSRRFEIFERVERTLLSILQKGTADDDAIREFTRISMTAPLLFQDELAQRIEKWRKRALALSSAQAGLSSSEPESENRKLAIDLKYKILQELSEDYEELGEIFGRHIRPLH